VRPVNETDAVRIVSNGGNDTRNNQQTLSTSDAAVLETVDASGRCVRSLQSGANFCPLKYDDALKLHSACNAACAGPVAGLLLYMDYCTPAHGCAYAADTRRLVGYQLASDAPSFCSGSARVSFGGQFPAVVSFAALDLNENCLNR
jgi:hypothetical protein